MNESSVKREFLMKLSICLGKCLRFENSAIYTQISPIEKSEWVLVCVWLIKVKQATAKKHTTL